MADERSYADRADGATTFDPDLQLDRDEDARTRSREEAVARAICATGIETAPLMSGPRAEADEAVIAGFIDQNWKTYLPEARAAITAYAQWAASNTAPTMHRPIFAPAGMTDKDLQGPGGITWIKTSHDLSAGLDAEIQKEMDTPPAPIMKDE